MYLRDIFQHKHVNVFVITENDYDNELIWSIEPTNHELVPGAEAYYMVKAIEVLEHSMVECYMGIMMPERVLQLVVKEDDHGQAYIEYMYHHAHSIIPAMACDCSGFYDIYSAKENPQAGIDVLRRGLEKATNKSAVAEDLGYLCIDEERIDEAIEAFEISEKHGPTTRYTYFELAKLYARQGDDIKSTAYAEKFKQQGRVNP